MGRLLIGIFNFVLGIALMFYGWFVLATYWEWFAIPILNFPSLTYWQIAAIALLLRLSSIKLSTADMVTMANYVKDTEWLEQAGLSALQSFMLALSYTMFWFVGYLIQKQI